MIALATGSWFTFTQLRNATEEGVRALLEQAGVDIGPDRVSVNERQDTAVVSLSREHCRQLLERALLDENGDPLKLNGRPLLPIIPRGGR